MYTLKYPDYEEGCCQINEFKNNGIILHFSKIEFIFPVAISGPPVAKCFVCSKPELETFSCEGGACTATYMVGGWFK